MIYLKLLFLLVSFFCFSSCVVQKNLVQVDIRKAFTGSKSITSVAIVNNQIIVKGNGLSGVTSLKIQNSNLNETFAVESATASQVVANGAHAVAIGMGQVFNLILNSAEGSTTFPVSFTIDNGSITAVKLSSMGASAGQFLKYNGTAWVPSSISSSQLYLGAWDANTNTPDPNGTTPVSGDYYIVTIAGTQNLGSGAMAYAVGNTIMYNGSTWDKIQNTATVNSFNGRNGTVVGVKGDYSLTKMSDVDLVTTPPITNDVLKYDGTNWVPGTVSGGGGGTVTNVSATGPISVTNGASTPAIIISQATTTVDGYLTHTDWNTFNNKEPAITADATTKYFRGDKTFVTLDTSVVAENTNLYFTNARVLGVPLTGYVVGASSAIAATDTVLSAFEKMQGQLNSKSDSASYIDWSTNGIQTIDPSRLNLGVGSAGQALVTDGSGFIVSGGATSAEVGYLSGVSSAIQTQLNAKQGTISKSTVQDVSKIRIYGANTTNYVELSAATLTGNRALIFPDSNGTTGQVLTTDGAGILSWSTPATGAPTGTAGGDLAGTYPNPTIKGNAITDTQIADGAISQAKINGLTTALSGKEASITAGTSAQYLRGDKTLSTFASDVLGTLLAGLSTATNAVIATTDSVIGAFGKLQKQITDLDSNKLNKTGGTLTVGTISGVPTPTNADDVVNKGYVDGISGQWTAGSGNVYRPSGNVGIGTTTPTTSLDINGTMRLSKNELIPYSCDTDHDGAIALTNIYTTCACKSTVGWVSTTDGSSDCVWNTATTLSISVTSGTANAMNVGGANLGVTAYGSNVTFTLTNNGGTTSNTISFALSNTTNFTITGGTCANGSTTLAGGEHCTIIVQPKDTQNESFSGNLNITANNNPIQAMSGTSSSFLIIAPSVCTSSGGTWGTTLVSSGGCDWTYTSAGTFSWIAPAGVTSVSVVSVGGGGAGPGGGAGGGLGYKNNITVIPGNSYTVVVGAGGAGGGAHAGGDSYFINLTTVKGGGGGGNSVSGATGGSHVGDGGGNGGTVGSGYGAASGAGGYSGNGGNGNGGTSGSNGAGGGGGGAGYNTTVGNNVGSAAGGGVGILGQGANGLGSAGLLGNGVPVQAGGSGSGGVTGSTMTSSSTNEMTPGTYGGGGAYNAIYSTAGGGGAVRIIWGTGRVFPSTLTGIP